jgi:ABC-type taurine transport system substrate-binding protein
LALVPPPSPDGPLSGLDWKDITPEYLTPADAAAAFSRGAIDAWAIWDPFLAIAELRTGARQLPLDPKETAQNSFFLANRNFAKKISDDPQRHQFGSRKGDIMGGDAS